MPSQAIPPLPVPPAPAPRNARGLRADSLAQGRWSSADQRWNGQWTLRPPDNLAQARTTATVTGGQQQQQQIKKRKKRRPAQATQEGDGSSVRPGSSASGPSTGPYAATAVVVSTSTSSSPPPRPTVLPQSSSSLSHAVPFATTSLAEASTLATENAAIARRAPSGRMRAPSMSLSRSQVGRLQAAQGGSGRNDLSRLASMRRRNVQEELANLDSDLTPPSPVPSYAYSLTIPVHRPAGEPPPGRPLSPPTVGEEPPPRYWSLVRMDEGFAVEDRPAQAGGFMIATEEGRVPGAFPNASADVASEGSDDEVGRRSPPPPYDGQTSLDCRRYPSTTIANAPSLPPSSSYQIPASPPSRQLDTHRDTSALVSPPSPSDDVAGRFDTPEPPTEAQRLWDLWASRGVGLGERVVRMRAFERGVLVLDEEDQEREPLQPADGRETRGPPTKPLGSSTRVELSETVPWSPERADQPAFPQEAVPSPIPTPTERSSTNLEAVPPPSDSSQAASQGLAPESLNPPRSPLRTSFVSAFPVTTTPTPAPQASIPSTPSPSRIPRLVRPARVPALTVATTPRRPVAGGEPKSPVRRAAASGPTTSPGSSTSPRRLGPPPSTPSSIPRAMPTSPVLPPVPRAPPPMTLPQLPSSKATGLLDARAPPPRPRRPSPSPSCSTSVADLEPVKETSGRLGDSDSSSAGLDTSSESELDRDSSSESDLKESQSFVVVEQTAAPTTRRRLAPPPPRVPPPATLSPPPPPPIPPPPPPPPPPILRSRDTLANLAAVSASTSSLPTVSLDRPPASQQLSQHHNVSTPSLPLEPRRRRPPPPPPPPPPVPRRPVPTSDRPAVRPFTLPPATRPPPLPPRPPPAVQPTLRTPSPPAPPHPALVDLMSLPVPPSSPSSPLRPPAFRRNNSVVSLASSGGGSEITLAPTLRGPAAEEEERVRSLARLDSIRRARVGDREELGRLTTARQGATAGVRVKPRGPRRPPPPPPPQSSSSRQQTPRPAPTSTFSDVQPLVETSTSEQLLEERPLTPDARSDTPPLPINPARLPGPRPPPSPTSLDASLASDGPVEEGRRSPQVASPATNPSTFEYTDLDLLVLGLEGAQSYEAATALSSFLGPALPSGLTSTEFASSLRIGTIVEVSRRVAKSTGKTKVKLSCPVLGVRRVDRCSYGCLGTFRVGDEVTGVLVEGEDGQVEACHLGHVKCAKTWFRESRACPVCRRQVDLA